MIYREITSLILCESISLNSAMAQPIRYFNTQQACFKHHASGKIPRREASLWQMLTPWHNTQINRCMPTA